MLTDDEIIDALENAGISLAYRDHDEDIAFARAVEQAAYAAAIKACENTQDYGLIAQVMKRDCADAIRRLTEQPK